MSHLLFAGDDDSKMIVSKQFVGPGWGYAARGDMSFPEILSPPNATLPHPRVQAFFGRSQSEPRDSL
jgi:hypothetical protein